MLKKIKICLFVCFSLIFSVLVIADEHDSAATQVSLLYRIQPGDVLNISVWGEETMQYKELRVLPDGTLSYPLTGVIEVKGKTIGEVSLLIAEKLKVFIPEPNVNVMVHAAEGNLAYVIGKVTKSGPISLLQDTTVLQALSLSGPFDKFADKSAIKIIRLHGGHQELIKFDYDEVSKGLNLENNIFLKPGDTIVVP